MYKRSAIPIIGTGAAIGAGAGGILGAMTGDEDQTIKQRIGRGLLGGMAGTAVGAGVHGGLRYNKLKDVSRPEVDNAGKVIDRRLSGQEALDEAFLGNKSTKAFKAEQETMKQDLNKAIGADMSEAEFIAKRDAEAKAALKETAKATTSSNPFANMSPVEARRAYREMMMKAHPDRGGTAEAFQKLQEQWKQYQALNEKVASAMYAAFFSELYNLTY